jgi:hypothetical protein
MGVGEMVVGETGINQTDSAFNENIAVPIMFMHGNNLVQSLLNS